MSTLAVQKREGTGKYVAFGLRREGKVPGVVYGKGKENLNISVPLKEFEEMAHLYLGWLAHPWKWLPLTGDLS